MTAPVTTTPVASSSPVNVKLLLIGNASVGKSSLLLRFSDEQWIPEDEATATIGVDFRVHKMEVNGRKVKLSIWDTAGQERFRTITSSYYRGAQGIIVVYDVANRETYDALPKWFTEIDTYVSSLVPKIIVGNKLDKEHSRQVSTSEGQAFATRKECLFLEASAKTSVGVREVFEDLVKRILETPELWAPVTPESGGGKRRDGEDGMPGTIDLNGRSAQEDDGGVGCAC
ncbi:ras-domain-containing protein [Pisolithus orientalis]|uniref:ras-domain-containing protein n=1 Tax=Pisolithus orientalis TaxID=936130 RepID=UPI00222442AA|nr:ras-domain-containing protein [Pisolithus orientalis]XP_051597308.1 ras-domain-containing protein [Pisolithus orientalis]KAI5985818.1 ras-domain-containing protein [Pisolithus orientalis]KAI5998507.1 ras-domain-containing protein [Pisolithus orientalis]